MRSRTFLPLHVSVCRVSQVQNHTWFWNVETHSSRLLSDVRVVEVAQKATHLTKFDESSTRIQPFCVAPGVGGGFEFVKVVKGHPHLDAAYLQLRAIFSVRSLLPIVGLSTV